MRYTLENDLLKISVASAGAELKSAVRKADGTEYMWQGDPKFWGRTSPVLFPIIGNLKNKVFRYKDELYPLNAHGFARDMEFDLISHTDTELWFMTMDTEETRAKYPFSFVLQIGYILKENTLQVLWKVGNPTSGNLYFSIGAHPGFNCPIHGESDKSGYSICFPGKGEIHHYGNDMETGLALTFEDLTLPLENEQTAITPDFFNRCTYIMEEQDIHEIGLVDPTGHCFVKVNFDMPVVAIWSPEGKNAPFVCIEPWYGRCDASDFEGALPDRAHEICLQGGELFENDYTITFQ